MTGTLKRLLEDYGQKVTICREEGRIETNAFLQPMTGHREQQRQELPTPLGVMRRDQWLYLGDPAVSLADMGGGFVLWLGRTLRVRAAQPIYVGETISHWWAVLDERDG